MSASLNLLLQGDPVGMVALGEIISSGDLQFGQPYQLSAHNDGDTHLRDLKILLKGEGVLNVQLAVDVDGDPGVWAAAGEGIVFSERELEPGASLSFWIRGVFNADDAEGRKNFNITFEGLSY